MSEKEQERREGFLPVVAALGGNAAITILKFMGFFATGSGALFSEAIHSVADTMNQSLLLVGIRLSSRRADAEYSYGYGLDRFLWALISACGIFFLGAGVTIYHGVHAILVGAEAHFGAVAFAVLGISFVVESVTFFLAFRELRKSDPHANLGEMLEDGDPATIAVLYEDGVAVLGVGVALAAIALSAVTGNPVWDAVGSIFIGLLLAAVAILLIQKNRSYLLRKNIPEETRDRIIEIMEADPIVEKVIDFKSSILDIDEYQIKCEVEFNGPALMREVLKSGSTKEDYVWVQEGYREFLRFLMYFTGRVPRLMGTRIDLLEAKIQKEIPEVKHIDIEIN